MTGPAIVATVLWLMLQGTCEDGIRLRVAATKSLIATRMENNACLRIESNEALQYWQSGAIEGACIGPLGTLPPDEEWVPQIPAGIYIVPEGEEHPCDG